MIGQRLEALPPDSRSAPMIGRRWRGECRACPACAWPGRCDCSTNSDDLRPSRILQDISCLVLPIPCSPFFFKQAVLQGQDRPRPPSMRWPSRRKILHLARCCRLAPCRPPTGDLPASRNSLDPAVIHRGCDAFPAAQLRRCSPHRADLPARCGSSLRQSTADASGAGCPSALVLRALCPVRIFCFIFGSLRHAMNQKSSLREVPQFVSRVLTANNP